MITLVAAMGKNNVIGSDNDMPWNLPRDLRHFKEITKNGTVLMGRKTFESIGRPLPNRKNIVLTRGEDTFPDEVEVVRSLEYLKEFQGDKPGEELFIIGGGTIYEQTISHADCLQVTHIHGTFEGDTVFPKIEQGLWVLTAETFIEKDEENAFDMTFATYYRR